MRDEAGGNGEAERLRLAVELAQENTGLHADGPGLRINMDPLHKTEIDNHPAVADRVAGIAVASSAYGDEQTVDPREANRRDDVLHPYAACDQRQIPIDRSVPHSPVFIVCPVPWANQRATEAGRERLHRARFERYRRVGGRVGRRHGPKHLPRAGARQELEFHPCSTVSRAGSRMMIRSRSVRTAPLSRSWRSVRTTTSRTVPAAAARSCCVIWTASSPSSWLGRIEARSSSCRATR